MKKKVVIKSARKKAITEIKQLLVADLSKLAGTLGEGSDKLAKKIEKGSKKLAKKVSDEIKFDTTVVVEAKITKEPKTPKPAKVKKTVEKEVEAIAATAKPVAKVKKAKVKVTEPEA